MYYFVEVACVIVEMWLIHLFLSSYFHKRMISQWKLLLSYITLGCIVTVFSLVENMVFARMLISIIGVSAIGLFAFNARPFQGFVAGIAFFAIVAVTDIVSALLFQFLGITVDALMLNHLTRSVYLIVGHVVMFSFVMLVCMINRRRETQTSIKILIPVVPCWIISILLCALISWQCFVMDYELHPGFIFVLLGMLYTNIIVIYHTNRISEQAQIKKDWEIAEHHYAMQQEYYDQLRIQQEETRALWHDISKYLRASQVEGSTKALSQVQQMLDSISCVVDVNNRIVSVILNEYYQISKNAGITLQMDVQVPSELFVTAADLYVLIGNTLDNAIEACVKVPIEERAISVKIKTHNNMLYYEVVNSFDENDIKRIRNKYRGFGLRNVNRCVQKYGGRVEISKEHSQFRLVAHLNNVSSLVQI